MTLAILPALIAAVLILMVFGVRWWHRWRWRRQIEAAHAPKPFGGSAP